MKNTTTEIVKEQIDKNANPNDKKDVTNPQYNPSPNKESQKGTEKHSDGDHNTKHDEGHHPKQNDPSHGSDHSKTDKNNK